MLNVFPKGQSVEVTQVAEHWDIDARVPVLNHRLESRHFLVLIKSDEADKVIMLLANYRKLQLFWMAFDKSPFCLMHTSMYICPSFQVVIKII